ncbi:hypothetical protein ABFA07_014754 [Porites harrisoni]
MLAAVKSLTAEPTIRGTADLDPHSWTLPDGTEAFKITITIKMQYFVPNGWRMALIFTQPIKKLEVWRAKVIKISADKKTYALKNMNFNPSLKRRDELRMALVAYKVKKRIKPGKIIVLFRGGNVIPVLPTLPPPTPSTPPPPMIKMYQLKPHDESDSSFKMSIKYEVQETVNNWRISLKFTKNVSTERFRMVKAIISNVQKQPTSDTFCLAPQPYNKNLRGKSLLQLQLQCDKAKLYEAAPNAFFVFHPDATKCEDFDLPDSVPAPVMPQESPAVVLTQQWPPNNFKMKFDVQVINSVRGGWKMILKFIKPVAQISNLNAAKVAGKSKDLLTYYIENFPGQIQYANLKQCEKIPIELVGRLVTSSEIASSPSEKPLTASVKFVRKEPEYAEINTLGKCPNASR